MKQAVHGQIIILNFKKNIILKVIFFLYSFEETIHKEYNKKTVFH